LFDENISPRLVTALEDLYSGSLHVVQASLASKDDLHVWEFARDSGFIVVTKDRDFHEFSLDMGAPPKVIWIGLGNCSTERIEGALRRDAIRIARFAQVPDAALLIIN
jgi:predicted nuclease of predicted toxin-antitoxin system